MTTQVPYTALSRVIQMVMRLDPGALERAASLAPMRVGIEVSGVQARVQLAIDCDTLTIVPWPDDEIPEIELAASPVNLLKMALPGRAEDLIRAGDVRVRGDAARLQELQAWLRSLDPDIEEWLSAYIGDVAAHQTGNAARHLQDWIATRGHDLQADISEFLTHEIDVVVTDDEMRMWVREVDLLRNDLARLEARVNLLASRRGNGQP
ncbi:MAG: SCP2 sterol-binding domain-containing protein [Pseudomonadota bacterium]